MGIEATGGSGPQNVVPKAPMGPPAPKPEAKPIMLGDNFSYSLPPANKPLKFDLPEHDQDLEQRPFINDGAFKHQAFKPRLGVSQDLGDGSKLDLDATFKHGVGVKVGFKKTF
jgi:hypothetical protein